jgi:hypothetical protein
MTKFEYINDNIVNIKKDIKAGIISSCVVKHFIIYARYDYYLKAGHPVTQAVQFTAQDNRVSETWVFNIIKNMESEI